MQSTLLQKLSLKKRVAVECIGDCSSEAIKQIDIECIDFCIIHCTYIFIAAQYFILNRYFLFVLLIHGLTDAKVVAMQHRKTNSQKA